MSVSSDSFLERCVDREAKLLQEQLGLLGLDPSNLSNKGRSDTRLIVEASAALGLRETSTIAFLSAVTKLRTDNWLMEDYVVELQSNLDMLTLKCTEADAALNILKTCVADLDAKKTSNNVESLSKQVDTDVMSNKAQQYAQQLEELQGQLDTLGFHKELQHGKLIQKRQYYLKLQQQLSEAQTKLDTYCDLPPNIEDACTLYNQKCKELSQLQNSLETELGTL